MECSICFSILLDKDKKLSTTQCGHVFHHECINDWIRKNNQKICPCCRKFVDINRNIILYLSDQHQQFLETKMIDINANLKQQNAIFENRMAILVEQNRQLKDQNEEIKEIKKMLIGLMGTRATCLSSSSTSSSVEVRLMEAIKAKNNLITKLMGEIHELKLQRTEIAKEIMDIKNRICSKP